MDALRFFEDLGDMDDHHSIAAGDIADATLVRRYLVDAARRRESMSYSVLLARLGHRFTRPKMRELCRTLDKVDGVGEPGLAVLVTRQADGLPGRGWWVDGPPRREGWDGPWAGPRAKAFVERLQMIAFDHWTQR